MRKLGFFILLFTAALLGSSSSQAQSNIGASVDVLFKKDKLIEVAFLSVKPDKQKALQESYFKQVFPIAQEYGLKPLARIQVENAYSEFVQPQMIGFFEWESEAKHQAFLKDPRFLKIKPIRDEALSFLRLGYFKVEQDTQVSFPAGKLIEVYAFWLDKQQGHRMQTYFKNVNPLITGANTEYDVQFPLSLQALNYGNDTYQPQVFGVAVWKSKESNAKFFSSKAYAKIKHDKDAALSRLDVWQGKIIIQ